jgi:hypothetical protein
VGLTVLRPGAWPLTSRGLLEPGDEMDPPQHRIHAVLATDRRPAHPGVSGARGLPQVGDLRGARSPGLIAGHGLGGTYAHALPDRIAAWGCAAIVVVFGVAASRTAGNEVDRLLTARTGTGAGSTVRVLVILLGYLIALASVLDLLALPVHYFVGGTVIAIVIGVAAQQVLGNLFAGLVLLVARPYVQGDRIRIHSGALGGPHEGVVTAVGLLYTTVRKHDGDINVPNSALLAAAVGPVTDHAPVEKPIASADLPRSSDGMASTGDPAR